MISFFIRTLWKVNNFSVLIIKGQHAIWYFRQMIFYVILAISEKTQKLILVAGYLKSFGTHEFVFHKYFILFAPACLPLVAGRYQRKRLIGPKIFSYSKIFRASVQKPLLGYFIVKILNLYFILSCTHLYHFFPVSIHYLQCIHCL